MRKARRDKICGELAHAEVRDRVRVSRPFHLGPKGTLGGKLKPYLSPTNQLDEPPHR